MRIFGELKPAVPKCWLFAASGVLWSAVGLGLVVTAIDWLVPEGWARGAGYGGAGVMASVLWLRRPFGGLAQKNIHRLRKLPTRGCVFAFQAWKSYLLILIMIALGSLLRQLPIQRPLLAVVYTAIGASLVLGSIHYYRHLMRLSRLARRRSGSHRQSDL